MALLIFLPLYFTISELCFTLWYCKFQLILSTSTVTFLNSINGDSVELVVDYHQLLIHLVYQVLLVIISGVSTSLTSGLATSQQCSRCRLCSCDGALRCGTLDFNICVQCGIFKCSRWPVRGLPFMFEFKRFIDPPIKPGLSRFRLSAVDFERPVQPHTAASPAGAGADQLSGRHSGTVWVSSRAPAQMLDYRIREKRR